MNYYQNFFKEIKQEYIKNNIEFKWSWTDAQNEFNSKQIYQVFEKQENLHRPLPWDVLIGSRDAEFSLIRKQLLRNIRRFKDNDELISYIIFYLSSKIKMPELFHYKMITSIKNNYWLDCYLGKSKSKAI
jgi:hypothetical protein